jgi:hypothetical protein
LQIVNNMQSAMTRGHLAIGSPARQKASCDISQRTNFRGNVFTY